MLRDRQKQMIKLLLQHKNGMTGEELSKLVGVSSRTVRTDVKDMAVYLETQGAKLYSDNRFGYRLEISNAALAKKLLGDPSAMQFDSPKARVDYILRRFLESALENKVITQQQLADELYVSLSTLKNSLKEAAKKLAAYDLNFATYKTQGMQIDGSEAKLRYFLSEYFSGEALDETADSEFYRTLFKSIDFAALEKIILRVINAYETYLTDMAVQNLLVHIAIAIERAKQKNYMVYTIRQTKLLEKTREFEVASSIFEEIFREIHIDTATSEVYYLAQHLMGSKKYMDGNESIQDQTTLLARQIIKEIDESVNIDFSKDDTLMHWLTLHLKTAMPRMRFQMNIRNDALAVIKSEYPLAFQLAVIAGNYIEKQENLTVNESEIGYIAIHFGAALSRMDIKNDACVRRVLLVCSTGIGTAVLLRSRIEEHFQNRVKIIDAMPGYKLNQEIIDAADIVITTVPIKHIESKKIVWLRHLLNQNEIQLLEQRFFAAKVEDEIDIEKFFRKDCFYTGQRFKERDKIIAFLTDKLQAKGLMDDAAKQSVFEREEASPTEIGNLVAIPHPIYNDPPVSSISIMVLDKPIIWDEQPVQLVFLLSIAKAEFKLWETIFLKLFNYLVKENGVKEILHHASYEAFIKNFQKHFSQE